MSTKRSTKNCIRVLIALVVLATAVPATQMLSPPEASADPGCVRRLTITFSIGGDDIRDDSLLKPSVTTASGQKFTLLSSYWRAPSLDLYNGLGNWGSYTETVTVDGERCLRNSDVRSFGLQHMAGCCNYFEGDSFVIRSLKVTDADTGFIYVDRFADAGIWRVRGCPGFGACRHAYADLSEPMSVDLLRFDVRYGIGWCGGVGAFKPTPPNPNPWLYVRFNAATIPTEAITVEYANNRSFSNPVVAAFDPAFGDWTIDVHQIGYSSIAQDAWVYVRARDDWGNVTPTAKIYTCDWRSRV